MRKMTRLRNQLNYYAEIVGGEKGSESPRLFEDFPEILNDGKFATSIYNSIRKDSGLPSTTAHRWHVSDEGQIVTFSIEALEIKLDLPMLLGLWLPLSYQDLLPEEGEYEKEEMLDRAIGNLSDILAQLKSQLEVTPIRVLKESWYLTRAHKGLGNNVSDTRRWINRLYSPKFKAGRKPARPDESEKQGAIRLYEELIEILKPGFDQANTSVTKIKAAFDAVALAGLPDHDSGIADQLWGKRSPRQAAICLIAQKFNKSERHVRRWVSGQ